LIVSALAYSVLPVDLLLAKGLPIIGWFDEIASLAVTCKKVCKYITPKIEMEVNNLLERWSSEVEY